MAYYQTLPFHEGETHMYEILKIPSRDNPTSLYLNPYTINLLVQSPIIALGTLDAEGRPWTTLWGGETGFSRAIAENVIGVKNVVDRRFDPVLVALFGTNADGEVVKDDRPGRMIGGLTIDLETRRRSKLFGRMIAGAVQATEDGLGEVQLAVSIQQTLSNCPKYLNKKHIVPSLPRPKLISDSLPLPQEALDLIAKADLFFISSSNHMDDMDTNHRGGPAGFIRVLQNDEGGCVIVYPEYSGNRLYQTLGNLTTTPKAGLVVPDFDTGDVLYITGTTDILVGEKANAILPRTKLVVKISVTAARFVEKGLPFRGLSGDPSPYNPTVKFLANEQTHVLAENSKQVYAKLVEKQQLTPTIARFRFQIEDPDKSSRWKPGQYVALSFFDELNFGYSHMKDDDPRSLNDDYLRTFTVSSPPGETAGYDHFEITIRNVGKATRHLFIHNARTDLTLPLKGFGGEFFFQQGESESVSFVAGGIGITPLIAQAPTLDLKRLQLYWTIRAEDLGLVLDTFARISGLSSSTTLFITGETDAKSKEMLDELQHSDVGIMHRRLTVEDLDLGSSERQNEKWYICTGPGLRTTLLEWLNGRTVLYEDFNY